MMLRDFSAIKVTAQILLHCRIFSLGIQLLPFPLSECFSVFCLGSSSHQEVCACFKEDSCWTHGVPQRYSATEGLTAFKHINLPLVGQ